MDELLTQLKLLLSAEYNIHPDTINISSDLYNELGFDGFKMMDLIDNLQTWFSIDAADELLHARTIGDIIAIIYDKQIPGGS